MHIVSLVDDMIGGRWLKLAGYTAMAATIPVVLEVHLADCDHYLDPARP